MEFLSINIVLPIFIGYYAKKNLEYVGKSKILVGVVLPLLVWIGFSFLFAIGGRPNLAYAASHNMGYTAIAVLVYIATFFITKGQPKTNKATVTANLSTEDNAQKGTPNITPPIAQIDDLEIAKSRANKFKAILGLVLLFPLLFGIISFIGYLLHAHSIFYGRNRIELIVFMALSAFCAVYLLKDSAIYLFMKKNKKDLPNLKG